MATIASTSKSRNYMSVLRRVMSAAWWGEPVTGIEQPPNVLNGEYLQSVNAAGTGLNSLIGCTSGSDVVSAPNGLTIPLGQTLTVTGTLSSGSLNFTHTLTALTTNGAVNAHTTANYVITKAGILADTLGAPTATTDDGVMITITSSTAYAHTLTATGLLGTGTASTDKATFAAYAGAGLTLMAYQGIWLVQASVGVTFS
jgi:hypothetical protein